MGCGCSSGTRVRSRYDEEERCKEGTELRIEQVSVIDVRAVAVKNLDMVAGPSVRLNPVVLITWSDQKAKSKVALHAGCSARIDLHAEFPVATTDCENDPADALQRLSSPIKFSVAHSPEDGSNTRVIIGSCSITPAEHRAVSEFRCSSLCDRMLLSSLCRKRISILCGPYIQRRAVPQVLMPAGLNRWLELQRKGHSVGSIGLIHVRVCCLAKGHVAKVRGIPRIRCDGSSAH